MSDNMSYDVFEKINKEDREKNYLLIDTVYKANPTSKNFERRGVV